MIFDVTSSTINNHNPTLRGRSDLRIENQVSPPAHETSLTNEASQRIVNDKTIEKLDEVLQKNGAESVRRLDYTDYTPEAVSSRILNFVQEAINRAGTRGENQSQLMQFAKAGIDKGFKDAENILVSLNALSGAIADNVEKTYRLIQDGLTDITRNRNKPVTIESAAYSATTHSASQSLALNIQTRDGDQLKLNLSRNEQTGQYLAQIVNPQAEAKYSEQTYTFDRQFSLSVNGSLDTDEMAAIEKLLLGVKDVADEFFNGNSKSALEAGLNLGYDSREIAAFSLNLNEQQSNYEAKAYHEINQLGAGGASELNQNAQQNLFKPVQSFLHSLQTTLNSAAKTQLFDDPKSNVIELLEYFSRSNEKHAVMLENLESKAGAPFNNIANDLLS